MSRRWIPLTFLVLPLLLGQTTPTHRPQPVDEVDLERYVGLWHEIARIPNRFQRDCAANTTAEYALREDGRIDVVNRCEREDGSINEARGLARVVDESSNARLKVSFVRFLGKSWFWGDYWILGLGDDYGWVLVGHPERKYGWILARAKTLPDATLQEIHALLQDQGYDPDRFVWTPQD